MSSAATALNNAKADLPNVADKLMTGVAPITGATTLTAADSGRTFLITPTGAGYTITIPAPTTVGLRYRFIQAANAAGATAITSNAANVALRSTASAALGISAVPATYANVDALAAALNPITVGPSATAVTTVNIVGNAAASVGDTLEYIATGSQWIAIGNCSARAGFTTA